MKLHLSKKYQLIMLAVIVFGAGIGITMNLTSACALNTVCLNDQPVEKWSERFGLVEQTSLLKQPLDSLGEALLKKNNIFKVDISYNLFNRIDIATNNFKPVCFMLDKYSAGIYGVNDNGRVVDLENCDYSWDNPVMTSIGFKKIFDYADDNRVEVVVRQLVQLKDEFPEVYHLIDEIDFGNSKFLKVSLDGLNYRLKLRAELFYYDIKRYVEFVSRFNPHLDQVNLLDLRYDGMIITCDAKG